MSRAGELPSKTQGAFAVEKTRLAGQETHFLPDCDCVKRKQGSGSKQSPTTFGWGAPQNHGATTSLKDKKSVKKPQSGPFPRCVTLQSKTGQVAIFLCRTPNARFQVTSPDVPAGIRSEAQHFYRALRANLYSAALPKVLQRKQVSFPSPSHTPVRRRGSYNPCEIINMAQQKRECGEQ